MAVLHRAAQQRARSLQDLRRWRRGNPADHDRRRRRRLGADAGRPVDLLQLQPLRPHADLADEAGRGDQQQITFDRFNNWFPHISPDGKSMVIISYGEDIQSGDHPFYKHVYRVTRWIERRGDRLRVRRPGHDQRAVVVSGRQEDRVRQQHGAPRAALSQVAAALCARACDAGGVRWVRTRLRASALRSVLAMTRARPSTRGAPAPPPAGGSRERRGAEGASGGDGVAPESGFVWLGVAPGASGSGVADGAEAAGSGEVAGSGFGSRRVSSEKQ